mgnify:CR=1 FL=1
MQVYRKLKFAWTMPSANTTDIKPLAQDAVTKQQYDAVQTNYEASKARYELLLRQRQSTTLVKQEQTHRLEQTDAGIKLAQAALELAR